MSHPRSEPARSEAAATRVLVTGSSGFVGRALCRSLEQDGHDVIRLVRREPTTSGEIRWDPASGSIDLSSTEPVDAVVHLAGENIAGGRWTEARMASIRDSRVLGTRTLVNAICHSAPRPRVFLSASATGFYGARGDEALDEGGAMGEGFLAETCRDWEAETRPAVAADIRVCQLRLGIVLGREGGALARMLLPFRLGIGGRLGHGRQWMSWISLGDVVQAMRQAIDDESMRGPINLSAPNPVTNADFTRALGRVLRRPTLLPAPAFALRAVFGPGMADNLLLTGARVLPRRLLQAGFSFQHPDVETALREV